MTASAATASASAATAMVGSDAHHDRVRSHSVLSTGSAGSSSDDNSPSYRSSLDSTSSAREGGEGGKEGGRERAGSLGVQGRLTSELIKPPDAHHESLFAPYYASDAGGPPAKKPPSYLPSSDGGAKGETWWMKGGGGSGGEEGGEEGRGADESLTVRLRRHKREAAERKEKEEREAGQRGSAGGGDGPVGKEGGGGGVEGTKDEALDREGKGEEKGKAEAAVGTGGDKREGATSLTAQQGQQQQQPATLPGPEASPFSLSCPSSSSSSSSNLPMYTITVVPWGRASSTSHPSSTHHDPPGCVGLFSCTSTGSQDSSSSPFSSSPFMTYKITLTRNDPVSPPTPFSSSSSPSSFVRPSRATSPPTTHTTIKRYSELLRYHHLWCERGLVPPSLKAKFPPKTLAMGMTRAGAGVKMGGGGESSTSIQERARKLQRYFEALLKLGEEGNGGGRKAQQDKVLGSPLFWAVLGAGRSEWAVV